MLSIQKACAVEIRRRGPQPTSDCEVGDLPQPTANHGQFLLSKSVFLPRLPSAQPGRYPLSPFKHWPPAGRCAYCLFVITSIPLPQ